MGTAVTRIGGDVVTLEQLLTKYGDRLAQALPPNLQMDAGRLAQIAISSVRKTPKLQECDAISIVACVIQGAQLGLEMDGVLGNAYMVPYAQQAQFILGYKGWLNLLYRSERVSHVEGKNVYAGDEFSYRDGTDKFIHHVAANKYDVPEGENPFNSDRITHTYIIINLSDGAQFFEVWPRLRIEQHRDRFSQGYKKDPKTSPWTFAFESMALKTVMRSVVTFAPISVDVSRAAGLEGRYEAQIPQDLALDFDLVPPVDDTAAPATDAPTDMEVLDRDLVLEKGMHKGKKYRELPEKYVRWMFQNLKDPRLKSFAEQELTTRAAENDPANQRIEQDRQAENGEENQDKQPFTELEQMEIKLVELLQDEVFSPDERTKFGSESEGGNHDEKWLDNQIQWVEQTIVKRRSAG